MKKIKRNYAKCTITEYFVRICINVPAEVLKTLYPFKP